ncbi:MAG: ATPase V [Bacteroidales bacterium]|nr:ATPase V [Bacteroidales bacterium]
MIVKMTKYSFVLLSSLKEDFLQELQKLGVIDIRRSTRDMDSHCEELVSQIEARKALISQIRTGANASILEKEAEKKLLQSELEAAAPWGDFDREALATFDPHFFCVDKKSFSPLWKEQFPLVIADERDGKVYFVVLGSTDGLEASEIEAPARSTGEIRRRIEALEKEIEKERCELREREKEIPAIEEEIRATSAEFNRYLAGMQAKSAVEDSISIFEGFAPSEDDDALKAKFDAMDIYWSAEKASAADNPPIKLKNNWFASQFESLTGMYGLPVYDEFDPTPILAPFFLLFFSMCMGDAGYGILLYLLSFLLRKMEGGLANAWKLVRFLGIGTFVVGILLGTFFGISLFEQAWVPVWLKKCMLVEGNIGRIAGYDPQMVLSILIGVFHICLAMIVKAVGHTRRFGFKENISTWGWTLLIVGGVISVACRLGGALNEVLFKWTIIAVAAVSALGIFIFNKPGRNPLLNVGSGLWDTYSEVTGILGDVLSYIRLYALGLAGGMLGGAFNSLAQMVLGTAPTWQWLPFVVILIIGHALNLAMSCLGAFVHPLRLTFVEYFKNSGYEGRGVAYNPLGK